MEIQDLTISQELPELDTKDISINSPEKKLLFSVIESAINDLSLARTRVGIRLIRSSIIWLFLETFDNIHKLYPSFSPYRHDRIKLTSFDNFCMWLDIDPSFFRKRIIAFLTPKFPYLSIFVGGKK